VTNSWKIRFRILEGWFVDKPSFATDSEATAYAMAVAGQKMGVVDFDVVPRQRPANSCLVHHAA
jgi:hypothetical protein